MTTNHHRIHIASLLNRLRAERRVSNARARLITHLQAQIDDLRSGDPEIIPTAGVKPKYVQPL